MAVRFYCDIEGFEDNWIEISEVWTRAEDKAVMQVMDVEPYFALLRDKVEAVHIVLPGGKVLSKPEQLTDDNLGEDIDLRLWSFVSGVLFRARDHLRSLGNFSGRLSSNGAGPVRTAAATPKKAS